MKHKVFNFNQPAKSPVANHRSNGSVRLRMSESFLRYTDLATAIQLARSKGLNTDRIVRALSANMTYAEALALARRAAPLLEIKVSEFMKLRRNE
jgi:hypothetical protein